jgi:CubicO group peptidase (beta-lactamase class C family)
MLNTSGLPRHIPGTSLNEFTVPPREEMVRQAGETLAISAPGSKVAFSHFGGALAHEIIAQVSGQPYARYMERHVFAPTGMRDTCMLPCSNRGLSLQGYDRAVAGTRRKADEFVWPLPATNAPDLAKFVTAFFRASSAGGPLAELQEGEAHGPNSPTWTYGFKKEKRANTDHLISSGYMNGYQTFLDIMPGEKLAVIVLSNAADTPVDDYADVSLEIAGAAVLRAATGTSALPDPAWSKYTGAYGWKNSHIYVQFLNGELSVFWLDNDAPRQTRTTLTPVVAHTFRMSGFNRQEAPEGEILIFELDADGRRATRVRAPSMYWLRDMK